MLPKFSRWRLTRDPLTGLVVLFGVLNDEYIAAHSATPFSDYFDPHLLHDLANDLHLQVVSSNGDGLRYAFILDRGSIGKLPVHTHDPFLDSDRLLVGVVYDGERVPGWLNPQTMSAPPINIELVDDHARVSQGVGAFLKVFDDIRLKGVGTPRLFTKRLPKAVIIDEEESDKRNAEYKADRQRRDRIRKLFNKPAGLY
jgi:hypothetical protein